MSWECCPWETLRKRFWKAIRGSNRQTSKPAWCSLAATLGMTEGAVKVAVFRLRQRYRDRLREAIARTVADPADVDDEVRDLFAALG